MCEEVPKQSCQEKKVKKPQESCKSVPVETCYNEPVKVCRRITKVIIIVQRVDIKDHIYRMVIVEGRCTMARSSSLGANYSLVDTKV